MIKLDIIDGDFYLPEIDLWLDPDKKQKFAFISHAHMDHVKNHQKALCSIPTRYFLKTRSKIKQFKTVEFRRTFQIGSYRLSLYPAGHILGASMLFIEKDGDSLLFSGDVKFNESFSSENIVIPKAKTLIIEASFGTKKFIFPKKDTLLKQLSDTLEKSETPVIFTYTLGKAQEILLMLKELDYNKTIFVHDNIRKLNKGYEKEGYSFPKLSTFPKTFSSGQIYILPVHLRHHHLFTEQQYTSVYTTGWALDTEKRKQMQCDIALPISDHAGFDELNHIIEQVAPEKIICHHGRPSFAEYLKSIGYNVKHITENKYNEG